MTTGENTDSIEIERVDNLTITSDVAYEKVTNDLKMEDTRDDGYLKQNTAGLVQEIPNISFLDIGDTFLETKKTFVGKEDYALVVGSKGKSVEAKPRVQSNWNQNDSTKPDYIKNKPTLSNTEILWLNRTTNLTLYPNDEANIPLTLRNSFGNNTAFELYNGGIKILKNGLYRINFGWGVKTDNNTSTWFRVGLYDTNDNFWVYQMQDQIDNRGGTVKGGHSALQIGNAGNVWNLRIRTDSDDALIYAYDTYIQIELVKLF